MADLLIGFGFDQTNKTDAYSTLAKQQYPNKKPGHLYTDSSP